MRRQVIAVLPTHNRRRMLERAVKGIWSQTTPVSQLLVVDNGSVDGSGDWLAAEGRRETRLQVCSLDTNTGGAGGYCRGLQAAYEAGAEWIWTLDDDAIPEPHALELLLGAGQTIVQHAEADRGGKNGIGFLASRVLWQDGAVHRMNVAGRLAFHKQAAVADGIEVVDYASFVSILISREAVRQCGLPIAEFFIGSDDVEYTWRITRAGFGGYEVARSQVRHLTAANEGVSVWNMRIQAPDVTRWKYRLRNLVAVNRRRLGGWWREPIRIVAMIPEMMRQDLPLGAKVELLRAALHGLRWDYERLIQHPGGG